MKDKTKKKSKMREMIKPAILRFVKSMRLQRGGAWRAVRVGVVVTVVVLWAWVYLVSSPTDGSPALTRDDWSSRSPNLQVAPPISNSRRAFPPLGPLHPPVGGGGKDKENEIANKPNRENGVNFIKPEGKPQKTRGGGQHEKNKRRKGEDTNPRYHRGQEDKAGEENNNEDNVFPKIFPQRRIVLPGDTGLLVEEEEDEEEEEEEEAGKWKGRNMEEVDNNHAMEEVDEVIGMGDDDIIKNIDDDFVQEDVGGEALNNKRDKREKQGKETINEKESTNNKNKRKRTINDLEDNPKNLDLEANEKQGQRLQKGRNEPPKVDLVAVEEEMRRRRARVQEVCGRHGIGPHAPPGAPKVKYPPTPSYETFYIDRGDRLAWCPIYKAASTSWLHGFLSLAGISESYAKNTKEQVSTVARRVWPSLPYDEAKEAMGMCVKAMVVRHPFERLASAFRDKLELVAGGEKHGTEHFYQKYGKKIVEKYRKKKEDQKNPEIETRNKNQELGQNQAPPRYKHVLDDSPPPPPPPPPPPQRYRHVIDETQPQQDRKEPTFVEFVRYLIDTDLTLYADDHWMPYHLSCTPCLLDYDVIAKFETLDRDQMYLLHKTGLQDKLKFSWRHLTKGNRTADVVKKYFADVSKKDLLKLYSKYRLDFEMFDYSVADYLGYVAS